MKYNKKINICIITLLISSISCKKTISIPPPVGTVTTSQVFSSDEEATAAAFNMYYRMINAAESFSNGAMTILGGMSSDELIPFDQTSVNQLSIQFQQNVLVSTNALIAGAFWTEPYAAIYSANAIIEGLQNTSGTHDSVKNELTGEAEFVRAFCNFYLTNLYGEIPLVTTINWHNTSLIGRTPANIVYQSIISDLKDAQNRLAADFSTGQGQRIIPNKWAATALLARVYLYNGDWSNAIDQANSIINNTGLFTLTPNIDSIFLINSSEAIWQLQQSNKTATKNATPEGSQLIPENSTYPPLAYLTSSLLNAFEPGDQRRSGWLDSTNYNGVQYYFPYKYKIGPGQAIVDGPYSEYYMVLRLAEQFLIRAEANAQLGQTSAAIADLNTIRNRAGLGDYTSGTQGLLNAIAHENQIEFLAEWGHRWLDLKRANLANTVLPPIKPQWTPNAQLYPIPLTELLTDPNLTQNNGY